MGSAEELPIFDCRLPIEIDRLIEIRHSIALNRRQELPIFPAAAGRLPIENVL